jgi:hypothetical protein
MQRGHCHAATNRSLDLPGIGVDVVNDLAACRKSIGVGMREWTIRKADRPVGKLKFETVPAFAPPALGDAAAFKHQMRPAASA